MVLLIYLVILVALGVFAMLAMQLGGVRLGNRDRARLPETSSAMTIDGTAMTPAGAVAQTLKALEAAQGQLRTHYPVLARMLGGYLHAEAIHGGDGVEAAVREMVLDWQPERKAVIDEIARVLADNADESEVRAIITSFCDLDLEDERYRAWLIWLQGQFNDL